MSIKLLAIAFLTALIFLVTALLSDARASEGVFGIPNSRYDFPSSTMHQFILGRTCLSLRLTEQDLACNPAFLADSETRQLRLSVTGYDKLRKANEYRHKIEDRDSVGIVESLLTQRDPMIVKASVDVWYQRENWAVGIAPVRAGFTSWVRNSAYQQVSADFYKETELYAKYGAALAADPHLRAGVTVRYLERDFFRKDIAFLDAMSDPDIIKIKHHKSLYIEPGLTYVFDTAWTTALSATITNVPVYQSETSLPFRPIFDLGFSTAPSFADGRLRTSTHFSNHPDVNDVFQLFRWGVIYDIFDFAAASITIGKTELGFGLTGHYDSLILGVGYKVQQLELDQWETKKVATYLFEAGLMF